jgi:HAD superfamily hydrolase (TIGR01457 family)
MKNVVLEGVAGALLDLDGCVYVGETVVPKAASTIAALKAKGLKVVFVTNNATKTAAQYASKLSKMGVAAEAGDILTSGMATADYLLARYGSGRRVYVLGGEALREELSRVGCIILGEDRATEAEFVVSCLDLGFTYDRLKAACYAIQAGARYIATNLDPSFPVKGGYEPGAGSIAAALTTATSAIPEVIGKPSGTIVEAALKRLALDRKDVIMVGDRLQTDIKAARASGLRSVLVLTGSASEDLKNPPAGLFPDATIDSIADLPQLLGLTNG